MIPFFRRIRKQLANDNKPLKYMRYAIGEIVLVVIGILIALQINNWNDERKVKMETEAIRQSNLKEIYNDLKKDVINLDIIINQLQEQKDGATYFLEILESKDQHINDSIKFFRTQFIVSNSIAVDRTQNTWDNLNASGQLLSLKEDDLTKELFDYYNYYDSRILNFSELPQQARFDFRKLDAKCTGLTDIVKINAYQISTPPNPSYFPCFLALDGLHESLIFILQSCYFNINWFTELKTQAQAIIAYMEENQLQGLTLTEKL